MTSITPSTTIVTDRRHHSPTRPADSHPAPAASSLEHAVESHGGLSRNLTEFERLNTIARQVVTGTDIEMLRAYVKAADTHLVSGKDDQGSNIYDYSRLDDAATSSLFSQELVGSLMGNARNFMRVSGDATYNPIQETLLFKGIYGFTPDQWIGHIKDAGSEYTGNAHNTLYSQQVRQGLEKAVNGATSTHLTKEDIHDIVHYIKLESKVDPHYMTIDDAKGLLHYYASKGEIPDKVIKDKPYYKALIMSGDGTHH